MTAIITDKLKKQMLLSIIDDVDSADNNYFIGIGKSEAWNATDAAPTPKNSLRDERNLGLSLQSVKAIADKSLVVPRTDWSSGAIYSGTPTSIPTGTSFASQNASSQNAVYLQNNTSQGSFVIRDSTNPSYIGTITANKFSFITTYGDTRVDFRNCEMVLDNKITISANSIGLG